MRFEVYRSAGFHELTLSIITESYRCSHMAYISTSGFEKASTLTPQANVDYNDVNQIKIIGIDLL